MEILFLLDTVLVACCVLFFVIVIRLNRKYELYKSITEDFKKEMRDDLTDMSANIDFINSRFRGVEAAMSALNSEITDLKERMEPEAMERNVAERIEKKWDDALSSIFNFDPFGGNGDKE